VAEDTDSDFPLVATDAELAGRTFGDFQLLRKLGQGGMGQVYLARQLSLKRRVAVKILRAELAVNRNALQRFRLEAEAVARITHANIVQVYTCSECDGFHFMVLEYVEGRNLRDFLDKKGPPELPVALSILRQIAAALQRAGESGIVHRDIKPENILVSRKNEVKVADFGLSRCFTADEPPQNLTQSGVTMGTPLYMSPEQVQGHAIDPRSDIYSLGVTAYHLLAGVPPFKGATAFEVALQHVQAKPVHLAEHRPDLPADLCQCVMRMLAKRPEDRYQTAREILRDLAKLREGIATGQSAAVNLTPSTDEVTVVVSTPSGGRKRWGFGAALVCLAGAAGVGYHWFEGQSTPPPPAGPVADKLPEPPLSPRERAIREQLEDIRTGVAERTTLHTDLALLYVHEGRLADADRVFRATETPPRLPVKIADIGAAVVMSHRDQEFADAAERSNELFQKALDPLLTPREPAVTPKEKVVAAAKEKSLPAIVIRNTLSFELTQAVAKALERNATNLKSRDKPMPPRLEALRRALTSPPGGKFGG